MGINPLAPQLSMHTGDCALSRKQPDKSPQAEGGRSQVFVVSSVQSVQQGASQLWAVHWQWLPPCPSPDAM